MNWLKRKKDVQENKNDKLTSNLATIKCDRDGSEIVLVPSGKFKMGSNDGADDEKPVHIVYLDAFYIGKYKVTNTQYKKFMDATGYKAPAFWNDPHFNVPNHPVVGVNWHDAVAYCEWAGKRLPTEAEWEKAARGGLAGKKYVWGNDWPPPNAAGNFFDETIKKAWNAKVGISGYDDGYINTSPVGSFNANGYGLYDIEGNVYEWCSDRYSSNYYIHSPKSNPPGELYGYTRVLRGGSWYSWDENTLRVSCRHDHDPTDINENNHNCIGFRCAMDVPK